MRTLRGVLALTVMLVVVGNLSSEVSSILYNDNRYHITFFYIYI